MAPKRGKAAADDAAQDSVGVGDDLPDSAAVGKLTVAVLREWCTKLSLPTDGLKQVLVDRVKAEVEKTLALLFFFFFVPLSLPVSLPTLSAFSSVAPQQHPFSDSPFSLPLPLG